MIMDPLIRFLCWLSRNLPDLPGRWRIVSWLKGHESLVTRLSPSTVKLRHGFRMYLDPTNLASRAIFISSHRHSGHLVRLFRLLVRRGDCVIDVGANLGYFTLLSSCLVGREGRVHAFEPSPQILRLLGKNLSLNGCTNVVVHKQAVSDRCCEVAFHTASSDELGLSSMRELGAHAGTETRVPAINIDSMVAEIPPVKLVKIDVEGAEFLVIRGMQDLMRRDAPYIILELIDVFLREMGSDAHQVLELLREHDYTVYVIDEHDPGGLRVVVDPPDTQCDVLAVPRTRPLPEGMRLRDARGQPPQQRRRDSVR